MAPTPEQKEWLWEMSRCATRLYNLALEQRRWHWLRYHHTRPGITYAQQNAQLVELKEAFPEFKVLYSLVAQEVLRLVQKNFNSFFGRLRSPRANGREETARPPRFKSSRYFFTLCYVQSGFALEGGRLVLSGGQGRRERIAIAGARWSASPTSRAWFRRILPKGRVTQKSTARCRTTGRW
ncbi:helix-turn-helix domain-containing protein [Desulfovirgula thermocuniculi]|uniref:helix-turn-helix domain-containing protein n=1 Tax=Desulfovirgula thermocuniculi TaxID=348842 RepID=UPI001B7FBC5D|nr:helix-turn-helix domain-containing protein [Desulfovirgula thermocuniculi]